MMAMLRPDERTAWDGFRNAAPRFAGESLAADGDGPDPPDVICVSASGRRIGVELTKWVEHDQIIRGKSRESFENSYLKIINSREEPIPERMGWVLLNPKPERVRPEHEAQFRREMFAFLAKENAIAERSPNVQEAPPLPAPLWNTPQGAPVEGFAGFPLLEEYLNDVWIFPRTRLATAPAGFEWIMFRSRGGVYTPDWMVQAAVDRIRDKIKKYEDGSLRAQHSLAEFDLLCFYCDEALLHNTPTDGIGFGFPQLAASVSRALAGAPNIFDKIFLFHPYEEQKVIQVYSAN
jgi:hypothetical protein